MLSTTVLNGVSYRLENVFVICLKYSISEKKAFEFISLKLIEKLVSRTKINESVNFRSFSVVQENMRQRLRNINEAEINKTKVTVKTQISVFIHKHK